MTVLPAAYRVLCFSVSVNVASRNCYFKTANADLIAGTELWQRSTETLAYCALLCNRDETCYSVAFLQRKTCLAYDFKYPRKKKSSNSSRIYMNCRDDGYELAARLGLFFKLHREKTSWWGARKECRKEEGTLITLDSKKKHRYILYRILKTTRKEGKYRMWTALRRKSSSRSYRWPSGSQFVHRWNRGDPDYGEDQCCFLVTSGIADDSCEDGHSFICEKKMKKGALN